MHEAQAILLRLLRFAHRPTRHPNPARLIPLSHFQPFTNPLTYPLRGTSIGKKKSPPCWKPRSHCQPGVSDESERYTFSGTITATHSLPDARKPWSPFHPRPCNESI